MNLRKIVGFIINVFITTLIVGAVFNLIIILPLNETVKYVTISIVGIIAVGVFWDKAFKENTLGQRISKYLIKDENRKVTIKDIIIVVIISNLISIAISFLSRIFS